LCPSKRFAKASDRRAQDRSDRDPQEEAPQAELVAAFTLSFTVSRPANVMLRIWRCHLRKARVRSCTHF
jgi:hypothetical protein